MFIFLKLLLSSLVGVGDSSSSSSLREFNHKFLEPFLIEFDFIDEVISPSSHEVLPNP